MPDIAWDGIKPKGYILSDGRINPAYRICVEEDKDVKVVNLDIAQSFKDLSDDQEIFKCQ